MPPNRNTQEFSSAAGIIKYILERERDPFRYLDNPSVIKGGDKARPVQPAQEPFYPGTQPQKGSDGQSFDLFGAVRKIFKDIF